MRALTLSFAFFLATISPILGSWLSAGCRAPSETLVPERLPSPIGEVFLPVYPTEVPYSVRMTVRALIDSDGTVRSAQIAPRSGNDLWDSLATLAIKSWRFSPALQNGRAVPAWIRFPVTLRFTEPHPIPLAEIVVPTKALADSLYGLLLKGHDFGALARAHSIGPTASNAGDLGARMLKDLQIQVQMAITSVGAGQVTRPVPVEGHYVIYRRLSVKVNS